MRETVSGAVLIGFVQPSGSQRVLEYESSGAVAVMLPHTFCRVKLGRTVCCNEEGPYFVLALPRTLYTL